MDKERKRDKDSEERELTAAIRGATNSQASCMNLPVAPNHLPNQLLGNPNMRRKSITISFRPVNNSS